MRKLVRARQARQVMTMQAGQFPRSLQPLRPGDTTGAKGNHATRPTSEQGGRAATLTIGQIARLTGVNAKAIRYYESVGLLPRPPRGANSYRRYGSADVSRILLLHRLRGLGALGAAAQPLLAQLDDARCADVRYDLLPLLDERLRALDDEIATLRRLRVAVDDYRRAVVACQPDPDVLYTVCVAQTPAALPGVGMLPCAAPFDRLCEDHVVSSADEPRSSNMATDDLIQEEREHASVDGNESCCACCA